MKLSHVSVTLDISQPVTELVDVISLVINQHPGAQREILQQLDYHVGEALAQMDKEDTPD